MVPTDSPAGETNGSTVAVGSGRTLFPPFDPNETFGTTGDRKVKWMWILVACFSALSFIFLWRANLQFGADGRNYLLSAISQVLAAIAALSATLPLAFSSLSDLLPSFGERTVASWHFRAFIALFAGTIAFSLALLCFACAQVVLVAAALAVTIGCLAGVVPYFVWIADRSNPQRHLDLLVHRADSVAHRYASVTNEPRLAAPANEVEEYLGLITQVASVAVRRGTSSYLSDALIGVLMLWLKYDVLGVRWVANRCRNAWGIFAVTNADNSLAVGMAADCATRILVRQCWQGNMRPSVSLYHDLAEALMAERDAKDAGRIVAVRGCWRLGIVAQRIEPNGPAARAVAHQIAVTQSEITEDNLLLLFPMFENHVIEWFRMFTGIDTTQELVGFRPLLVQEHAEFRRRLAEATS